MAAGNAKPLDPYLEKYHMNKEEIWNMPAGNEMDALVLASVFDVISFADANGKPYKLSVNKNHEPIPNYSGDISAAWAVAHKLASQERVFSLHVIGESFDGQWKAIFENAFVHFTATAETVPLAICRAALMLTNLR